MSSSRSALADTVVAAGTATTPAANAAIATIAAPGVGNYYIQVRFFMSGTAETAATNLELRHGATVVGKVGFTNNTTLQVTEFDQIGVAAGEAITVNATVLATTSAIYNALILATRV